MRNKITCMTIPIFVPFHTFEKDKDLARFFGVTLCIDEFATSLSSLMVVWGDRSHGRRSSSGVGRSAAECVWCQQWMQGDIRSWAIHIRSSILLS